MVVDKKNENEKDYVTYDEDPRDYEIHSRNLRKFEPDRDIESLEKSILARGKIVTPLLSDEDNKIIDGGRRLRLAKKHNMKIAVLHRHYGEGVEADLMRTLDSMILNMREMQDPYKVANAIDKMLNSGMSYSDVADMLGMSLRLVRAYLLIEKTGDRSFRVHKDEPGKIEEIREKRKKSFSKEVVI